jgi:hypothetical protein
MVGMGTVPPNGPNDSLNQQMCGENRLYKSFLEYDQLYLDKVQELYNIPQEERTPTIQNILNSIGTDKPKPFANNSRFFGFRGPMMLHGWGYDTEGYPVPNASGDYLYLPSGTDSSSKIMLRQTATGVENGTVYDIYQTQKFIRTGDLPSGIKVPDDAIIVNYLSEDEQNRGYFTEPVKDHRFAKGWAQTPSRWPVGPIDLRWDEKSHVWTVPTTYRNVYILLEEDLIGQKIARGELINNDQTELARSPAALGYRKTVFVRDTFGLYAAPRTALIYCAYDPDSGYYEPISQNSFTTSGTIISSNTASMGALFKKDITFLKNNSQSVSQNANFVATFSNPLDISIDPGDIGLFTYLQDGWIVQSTRG